MPSFELSILGSKRKLPGKMGCTVTKNPRNTQYGLSDFDYVRLTWVDMAGRGRGKTIPSDCFISGGTTACKEAMDGTIPDKISRSTLLLPDISTLHFLPWASTNEYMVGQLFCEMRDPQSQLPVNGCCRIVAKEQLLKLENLGYTLKSGFEIEFTTTFEKTKLPVFPANLGTTYMNQDLFIKYQDIMFELQKQLQKAGAVVETMHTELCAGQFEVTFEACNGILAADTYFLAASAIQTLTAKYGMEAHFDAVMLEGETGNASHYNTSLLKRETGSTAFWDDEDEDNLSDTARHWIAGILHHIPALTALCAPTAACYARYHTPWNPDVANWDIDNRACSLRAKNWGPALTYLENRLASGKANPYLVMAGTVAAGMHGLTEKLKCPSKALTKGFKVPHSVWEALAALEADQYMVKTLGEGFVQEYIKYTQRTIQMKMPELNKE